MRKKLVSTLLFILMFSSIVYARDIPCSRAKCIRTDTSNFDNILSNTDTRVQTALDTLDDMDAGDIKLPEVGSPTYGDLQDFINNTMSSGFVNGGTITDNSNGTVAVAAGQGYIRADSNEIGELKAFDWAAVDPLDLTDDDLNYVYVDYNSGSPQVTFTTDLSTLDHTSEFVIGLVYQESDQAHIATAGQRLNNFIHDLYYYSWEYDDIQRASGLDTTEDASENLALNITAGVLYWALERHTTSAFDSSTDGSNHTFSYICADGTTTENQHILDDNGYDDGDCSNGVGGISSNNYGVHWVYSTIDGDIYVQYGASAYPNLAGALGASRPSTIDVLNSVGVFIAKIILQEGQTDFYNVYLPWSSNIGVEVATDHGALGGLTDDDHTIYLELDGSDTMTGELVLGQGSTAAGSIKILEDTDDGSNSTTIKGVATAADLSWILPSSNGTAGQVLEIASVSSDELTLEWDDDNEGAGAGGDPVLVDTTAIADASGVDLTSGVGVDITLNTGASPDTATFALDGTEIDAITWSDNANASNIWTFDVSGTDHTMTAGNGLMTFSHAVTVSGTLTGTLTGNADTATALAGNGANCNAGEYPLGVDASGAVENCTDATTEINTEIGNVLDGTDAFTDFNGADIIDSDNYNADSIDDEHIDWANLTTPTLSYVLGKGADAGDTAITSLAKLEGLDNALYVDMGNDTYINIAADAYIDLSTPDVKMQDNLQLDSDSAVIELGADQDVTITHVADTGLAVNLNFYAATYGSDGSVSDTELKYINSLSSNAQTQLSNILDGTTAFTGFNGAVIDSDNLAATLITGLDAVGTFESGDTFICNEAGVGLRECDYDDLPSGSGDVSGVGDCGSGDCLDGTSDGGTYIRLYDGDSNYTEINNGDANQSADLKWILPDSNGTAGQVLEIASVASNTLTLEWDDDGGDGGGTPTTNVNLPIYSAKLTGAFVVFTPPTADACSAGAGIDAGDGNWRLLFDASTDECATWQFIMPDNYSSTPKVDIYYTMASGTSDDVEFEAAIMCVSDGDSADVGTASFSNVAVGSATVPGTAGYLDVITITITDDSCAAGDLVFLVISTDANDATNDDATGDREVVGVDFNYTGAS